MSSRIEGEERLVREGTARGEGTVPRRGTFSLRAARPEDAPAVRRLLAASGLPLDGLAEHFPQGFVVAEHPGEVVAAAGVEARGDHGLLRSVVVAPSHRGTGLGAGLVRDRIEWSRAQRLHALVLLTTTAEKYFERLGFTPIARREVPHQIQASAEFAGACPASAVVMRLVLGGLESVRARYAAKACSAPPSRANPVSDGLYPEEHLAELPAVTSLGCGNPLAIAALNPGEVVLDLGSGGGLDVLLSARRVGPNGRAIGLDATEEMLTQARANQAKAGITNAEFRLGTLEAIPLAADGVDVVLSNCVLNLSVDKPRALAEAWRVLRPGGRLAVADIVALRDLPSGKRRQAEQWLGCISGTLRVPEYRRLLEEAGFERISIEPTRRYGIGDARTLLAATGRAEPAWLAEFEHSFASALVRAHKPVGPR